jgi:hypothetical protein
MLLCYYLYAKWKHIILAGHVTWNITRHLMDGLSDKLLHLSKTADVVVQALIKDHCT